MLTRAFQFMPGSSKPNVHGQDNLEGYIRSNQPSTWLSAENWPTWSLTSILGGEPFVKNGSTSWGNLKYPTIVGNKLEPTEGFEIKLPVARGCCRYHWTCWEILSPKNTVSKIYCSIGWKCLFLMMMGYGTISNKLVLDRGFLVHINGMKSESKFFISPTLFFFLYFPSYGFAIKGIDSKSLWYSTDGLHRRGTSGPFGKGCGDQRGLTLHGDNPGVLVI